VVQRVADHNAAVCAGYHHTARATEQQQKQASVGAGSGCCALAMLGTGAQRPLVAAHQHVCRQQ
jgi:hypothetical protein